MATPVTALLSVNTNLVFPVLLIFELGDRRPTGRIDRRSGGQVKDEQNARRAPPPYNSVALHQSTQEQCSSRLQVSASLYKYDRLWSTSSLFSSGKISTIRTAGNFTCTWHQDQNKKFELMLTRRAKAYSSSGSVVKLKIGVFTLS